MRVIAQLLLVLAIAAVVVRLLRSRSARGLALRRVGAIAFGTMAALSVLFPDSWTTLANLVGIGRGTDLVLYGLVVAFLSYTVTSYSRFRELEARQTILTRRLALEEAPPPAARDHVEVDPGTSSS